MVIHYQECFGCLSHNYMWRWELLSPREAQLIPSQSVLAYFSKQVKLRAVLWLETMGANHGTVHMTSELQRQLVQVFWSTGCGGFTEGRGRDLIHCLFRVTLKLSQWHASLTAREHRNALKRWNWDGGQRGRQRVWGRRREMGNIYSQKRLFSKAEVSRLLQRYKY